MNKQMKPWRSSMVSERTAERTSIETRHIDNADADGLILPLSGHWWQMPNTFVK